MTIRSAHTLAAWLLAVVALLWFMPPAAGQRGAGEPTVSASFADGVLRLGAATTLTVTVDSPSSARLLDLPRVEGLRFGALRGPDIATSMTFVQGRSSTRQTQTWRVAVTPERLGEFTLPPVSVEIGGRIHSSAPVPLLVVEDLEGQTRGFLEFRLLDARPVEGLPLRVEVRLGWDAALTRINTASLSLPWWDRLPGVVQNTRAPRFSAGQVTVNRQIPVEVERIEGARLGDRPAIAYRFEVELLPTRAGTLELGGSFLEFAEVGDPDFFGNRRRRAEYYTRADNLAIEVERLPVEGQPLDFGGAVGSFELSASADVRDVRAGDSIKLEVVWSGRGNLASFAPPDPRVLDGFEGLRSFGWSDEREGDHRRVIYDLVPLGPEVEAIPPITFPFFDTEAWEYRRLETPRLPIRVRPLEGRGLEGEEERPRGPLVPPHGLRHAPFEGSEVSLPPGPTDGALGGMLAAVLLTWLALRTAARRGGIDPGAPLQRRRRRALARLRRDLTRSRDPEGDLAAWTRFVAARTGERPEAWAGRDVRQWAESSEFGARLTPFVIGELEHTGRALEAVVFGGGERVRPSKILFSARGVLEEGL